MNGYYAEMDAQEALELAQLERGLSSATNSRATQELTVKITQGCESLPGGCPDQSTSYSLLDNAFVQGAADVGIGLGKALFNAVYEPLAMVADLGLAARGFLQSEFYELTGIGERFDADKYFVSSIGQAAAQGATSGDLLLGMAMGIVTAPFTEGYRLGEGVMTGNWEQVGNASGNLAMMFVGGRKAGLNEIEFAGSSSGSSARMTGSAGPGTRNTAFPGKVAGRADIIRLPDEVSSQLHQWRTLTAEQRAVITEQITKAAPTLESQLKLDVNAQRWLLREAMGTEALPLGNVAHHAIPLEAIRELPELMTKAAQGGFNINGKGNGFSLSAEVHGSNTAGHPAYNAAVLDQLRRIDVSAKPSVIATRMQQVADTLNQSMKSGRFLPRG